MQWHHWLLGPVTDANSLIGAHASDNVGNVIALTNGNYVVSSLFWDNGNVEDAGAATFAAERPAASVRSHLLTAWLEQR